MRVAVLGSGSRGNAVAVEADGAVMLVDAGFSARQLEHRARQAGLDLDQLVGIALTHEHGDHACGAAVLARRRSVPLLGSPGTLGVIVGRAGDLQVIELGFGRTSCVGPFLVEGCPTNHDAAEPLAIVVRSHDGERSVGVAHDLGRPSAALRYFLRGLSALVLEANHDEVMLRTSDYPAVVRQRIAGSGGHISNRAAAELLAEVSHAGLCHVVLAHLSERCNTEAEARSAAEAALREAGYGGALHVARQDAAVGPFELVAAGRRA